MPRPRSGGSVEVPKVLEKALRVLEAFSVESPVWSEAELRKHLGIPSTTLNRILRSLEAAGYLLRYEDGRYQLGIAAVRLGNRASESLNLATVLDTVIRDVARQVDELTLLAVPEFPAGVARYIAALESSSRVRVVAEVGSEVPLSAGATARVMLAFQPEERIEAVLSRPLQRLAVGTLTDPDVVREQLALVRERQWGFSWEETYDGAWAVAAPVLDEEGRTAFASIGVAAPTSRYSERSEQEIREVVCEAAARAARELGYAPLGSSPPEA